MKILARKITENTEEKFSSIESTNFPKEEHLQKLIFKDQIMNEINLGYGENRKLVTLTREFEPGPAGKSDVLAVDEDGNIYIIETKLHKNSDRRQILAQVMDYAGDMWTKFKNVPIEEFQKLIVENNSTKKVNSLLKDKKFSEIIFDTELGFDQNDMEVDDINKPMEENFLNGDFKFVLVFDELDEVLKNTIEYLNTKGPLSIYAVKYDRYLNDTLEILIPSVFGRDAEKRSSNKTKSGRIIRSLDETKLIFKDSLNSEEYKMFIKLYEFLETKANSISLGTGALNGSISPVFWTLRSDEMVSKGSFFTLSSNGVMNINYPWLKPDLRNEIRESFCIEPELKIDRNSKLLSEIDLDTKNVAYSRDQWSNHVDFIIEIIEKFI